MSISTTTATAAPVTEELPPALREAASAMRCRAAIDAVRVTHLAGEIVHVDGRVLDDADDGKIYYAAAAPAERRQSFSGSGLPFADSLQAFHATPNVGAAALRSRNDSAHAVRAGDRATETTKEDEEQRAGAPPSPSPSPSPPGFRILLKNPNAYYAGLGSVYVAPSVHVWYVSRGVKKGATLRLNGGIPFRMLTYPTAPTRPRTGPEFYLGAPTFARSQEQILRDSAFPATADGKGMHMPPNFWGLKPPV